MPASISKTFKTGIQNLLGLTLYDMMQSSHDFQDVRTALNDLTDWSIELFRSCFAIHLSNGGYFFMLCTLTFLVMAESIHIHYGRLSPLELKKRAEHIGYAAFAILFAILDIGFVIVRVAGLAALSGSPAIAAGLALVSISPSVIFPVFTYPVRFLRQRKRKSGGEIEIESGVVIEEARN